MERKLALVVLVTCNYLNWNRENGPKILNFSEFHGFVRSSFNIINKIVKLCIGQIRSKICWKSSHVKHIEQFAVLFLLTVWSQLLTVKIRAAALINRSEIYLCCIYP